MPLVRAQAYVDEIRIDAGDEVRRELPDVPELQKLAEMLKNMETVK